MRGYFVQLAVGFLLHVNFYSIFTYIMALAVRYLRIELCTWSHNKVRELIAVKVLHNSLLNTTVVAFKVLLLGSYAPMPVPSPPLKTNGTGLVGWPSEQPLYYS
jgi:hypothetical protein